MPTDLLNTTSPRNTTTRLGRTGPVAFLAALLGAALALPIVEVTISADGLLDDLFVLAPDDLPITREGIAGFLSGLGIDLSAAHKTRSYSVISGVQALWSDGHLLPAALIALFSILIPILKVGLLARSVSGWGPPEHCGLARALSNLHRWAMLDVFAVAVLLLVLTGSVGMSAAAGPALLAFLAFVLSYPLLAQPPAKDRVRQ